MYRIYKIFSEVGHGGKDSGAVGNSLKEKDIALVVALEVDRLLKQYYNVIHKLSRYTDETETLTEAIEEEKAFNSDYAIAIHINAGGGDGFEVYHHSKGTKSKALAMNIEKEIIKLGQNSRGLKTRVNNIGNEYYGWIRETKGSAIILELAFIDNKNDISIIDEPQEQKAFALAIVKGIATTLSLPAPVVDDNNQNTNNQNNNNGSSEVKVYRLVAGAFNYKENAITLQNELAEKGVLSWLDDKSLSNMYRVVIGSYESFELAKQRQKEFTKIGVGCYIIS